MRHCSFTSTCLLPFYSGQIVTTCVLPQAQARREKNFGFKRLGTRLPSVKTILFDMQTINPNRLTGTDLAAFRPDMIRIRPALIKASGLLFSLVFLIGFHCHALPTEYQIKAAFIYNFARFVEWPSAAFTNSNSPMIIGVFGENVFGDNLERTISGNEINCHPLQFKMFNSVEEATNCHVLFIGTSEKNRMPKILARLQGTAVLTVSENTDTFIANGGMINLVIVEDKVRFRINNDAAKKSGLIISSKLLSLAVNSP